MLGIPLVPGVIISAAKQPNIFDGGNAPASSTAFDGQPDKGRVEGFEFARDPLNAKRPMQPAEEIMQQDIATKPKVMADRRRLLESRYDLTLRLDSSATMSRGKPLVVGPTARLASGVNWQSLAAIKGEETRSRNAFPYPAPRRALLRRAARRPD